MAPSRPRALSRRDGGVTAIEYALLLSAIAGAIVLVVMFGFRGTVQSTFSHFMDTFTNFVNNPGGGGGSDGGGGGPVDPSVSPSPTISPTATP